MIIWMQFVDDKINMKNENEKKHDLLSHFDGKPKIQNCRVEPEMVFFSCFFFASFIFVV